MHTPFALPLLMITGLVAAGGLLAHERPLSDFMKSPPPQTLVYREVSGEWGTLFYFHPKDLGHASGDAPLPAIVWIHGGAWVGGTTDGFMPLARYCASRGLVAFNIHYRLAKAHQTTVRDCVADCRSAVRYIRQQAARLGVDPNRIAVAGDSAGGHLAAALGTLEGFDNPEDDTAVSARPNALLLYNPIVDMTEGEWIRFAVGGQALEDRKSPLPSSPEEIGLARSLSPLFAIRAGQPPALLMHGKADKVVPVSQAERFAEAFREAGNRCDLILLDNMGHAFVIAGYKWPETIVVNAVCEADRFLESLGWISGPPSLVPSNPPAW